MNPALLFLLRRSFVNAFRKWFQRLKNPRYLLPTLVGVGYFLLIFGPLRVGKRWSGPPPGTGAGGGGLLGEWAFTAVTLLFCSLAWLFPARGTPLAFTEAEVSWLFPGPVTRKELVRYKLLQLQKYLWSGPAFFAVISLGNVGPLRAFYVFIGTWLWICTVSLHGIGAKMTRLSLAEHGASGFRRQALPLLAAFGFGAFVILTAPHLPDLPSRDDYPKALDWLRASKGSVEEWLRALGESPAGWALYPFRIAARPALARDLGDFLLRIGVLGGMAAILYAWVLRNDVAFEEAAAAHAETFARRMDAARKGKFSIAEPGKPPRKSPWRLGASGSPEVAFIWKSVTETLRGVSPRFVVFGVVAIVLGVLFARDIAGERGTAGTVAMVALAGTLGGSAALLVFGGPSFLGVNLRQDLERIEILKTLPLTGGRLVRCSLAGTVVPVAVLQAFLVIAAVILFPQPPKAPEFTPAWRVAAAGIGILALPCLTALSAAVEAAGPLFFPSWIKPGQVQAGGGMEGMGYNIVTGIGKMIVLGLCAGLPAAIGVGIGYAGFALGGPLFGPAAALAGAVVAAAVVLGEVWILAGILGGRFERLDPADEGMIS